MSDRAVPTERLQSAAKPAEGLRLTDADGTTDSPVQQQRQSFEREEHRENVRRFRVALFVGISVWIVFGALDWVAVRFSQAGSLGVFWGIRLAVAPLAFLAIWLCRRDSALSPKLLRVLDVGIYSSAAYGVALMAAYYGGISSRYPTGIMLILVARVVFWAQRWQDALLPSLLIASSYPVVMLIAAFFPPNVAAQFSDPSVLAVGVHHLFFIYGTAIVTLVGSDFAWSLRRQLFESRSIGRYQLRRRLGRGGMGEVWAAYHRGLKREVAVKIMRLDAPVSETAVLRFEREVQTISMLTHPNTVRVFDYGVTEDGLRYYAMELLKGDELGAIVRREGKMAPERAVYLILQAARALAEAHARGVVHRDLKPANLFVTTAGGEPDFIKILDFGIAKFVEDATALTRTGEIVGTPRYMAPEVLKGRAATPRSDVYGLGVILYTLLTGHTPFEGTESAAVFFAIMNEVPSPPSGNDGNPSELDLITLRCLEKDPDKRYADGAELAGALDLLGIAWRPVHSRAVASDVPQSRS